MTTITNHSNPKYIVITDATAEMLEEAKVLVAGKWARITETTILVHVNFSDRFETMLRKAESNEEIAPRFSTDQELVDWLYENNFSGKSAYEFEICGIKRWNEHYAGKTVAELKNIW